jgi:COP9 signalosome complex subunit 3
MVLTHYQRWQILNLREAYTKISLEQIRATTQSAETAAPLATEAEIEVLVQSMIDDGMLLGRIERPTDGRPAYLEFYMQTEELSEAQFAEKVRETAQRLNEMAPVVRETDERLGTNRDYIRWVTKESKKKDETAYRDPVGAFDSHIDDEDLMTGITLGL